MENKKTKPVLFDSYKSEYINTIWKTNEGYYIKIIDYRSSKYVDIEFIYNGFKIYNVLMSAIKNGRVKNPFHRKINGGYIGFGPYNDSTSKIYNVWDKMLTRVTRNFQLYNKRSLSYANCTVCEEWYNYQNFATWYDNYISSLNPNLYNEYEIDKDILQWNQEYKIYSPQTCCLVPHIINTALIISCTDNNLPMGVFIRGNKYGASININGERLYLGLYDTPQEAFNVYKIRREKYIKDLANYYYSINAINKDIFDALNKLEIKENMV